MHTGWLLPLGNAFSAAVAQIGRNGNFVPIEILALIIAIEFLPGAVVEHTYTPSAKPEVVFFFARNFASVASRTQFVVDQQSILSCHH